MTDIFYVPEIEMVNSEITVAIADVSKLERYNLYNEELLSFIIGCKDRVMLDVFIEDSNFSNEVVKEHILLISLIPDILDNIFPGYLYVESFINDDINVVTPIRSYTFDRIISFKPLRIVVLLRNMDE